MGSKWETTPNGELLREGNYQESEAKTVVQVFEERVKLTPNNPALSVERDGEWKTWSYQQYYDDCKLAAKSMIKIGLEKFHAVCIIGFNSPEWVIADVGSIMAGGFAAGIYTTNSPEACHFVANDCEANIIFVENDVQLKKILEVRDKLPHLKAIVQYLGKPKVQDDQVFSWEDFLKLGQSSDDKIDQTLQERMTSQKPGNCCTLIYTSGTTGNPKGVMLSHDNLTWTAKRFFSVLKPEPEEHVVSYLPLSHVAAQMIDIHLPMMLGGKVWFARPDALKGSLVDTLKLARPTLFLGVPRVWEKIAEKMQKLGKSNGAIASYIGSWAKYIGYHGSISEIKGSTSPWGWWLTKNYFFPKIRQALGLDRCRLTCTAAAPISQETVDYFLSVGIPLYEIYGMSECTGPQTLSVHGRYKPGSCGFALPGTKMRIENPDSKGDGEILYTGRHIMMGYLNQQAKTQETFSQDGWLRSGDIGRIDSDGFLYITGRLKELIITGGGENIPPVLIEDEVKECLPILSNCMLIGDKKKFLSIIVALKTEVDSEGAPTDKLDQSVLDVIAPLGSNSKTVQEAIQDEIVKKHIEKGIIKRNERAVSNAQKIQKFIIAPIDFSVNGGELGPTLKLRRQIVLQKYTDLIEPLYDVDE